MNALRIKDGAIEVIDFANGSDELYKLTHRKEEEPIGKGICVYYSGNKSFFEENNEGTRIVRFYGDCIIAPKISVEKSARYHDLKERRETLLNLLVELKIVKPEELYKPEYENLKDASGLLWQITRALWETYPKEIERIVFGFSEEKGENK